MRKILLAGITKDERKLDTILSLYNQDFTDLRCYQVSEISELLFSFVPKNNQYGFKKFISHLNNKQAELYSDFKEIVHSKVWQKTFLKNIESDISFPDFEEPMRASRVKTEEDNPKKTLRRSVKR